MDKNTKISLYRSMLRIRMAEERICELYPEHEIRCPVHICIGQEAVASGVCANLTKDDYLMSNHRSHGHYLAKGGSIKAMFAELYGKASGCSGGKGGSMHLVDLSANILGTTPIVAGSIPVAVGTAFGSSIKKENRISVVFFGDAATEEGVFCESLNFAALKKLPIIFVCENNLYSVYSPLSVRQPKGRDNLALVRAYGIRGAMGDGNDVTEVYKLAKEAAAYVRKGRGPYYLQFNTYRWKEHCGPNYDNDLGYRTENEFLAWRKRCPVNRFEKELIRGKVIDAQKMGALKQEIREEIEDAVSFAKSSSFPRPEDLKSYIYA
ncbi:MAG: thiamine pyrophosphate-dependent dehydrogenase E1 component subunit alpha [Candidatus Omnitrophica bacterium]|nr:thiamine pyrophosphate-dependent dehydrogenase E1 component subunit alpha [Candidatus Omnitrophota bacterium]